MKEANTDQQDPKFLFKRAHMISVPYLDKAGMQARELGRRGGQKRIHGVGKARGRGGTTMANAHSFMEPMPEASRTPGILEEWISRGPIHLGRMPISG